MIIGNLGPMAIKRGTPFRILYGKKDMAIESFQKSEFLGMGFSRLVNFTYQSGLRTTGLSWQGLMSESNIRKHIGVYHWVIMGVDGPVYASTMIVGISYITIAEVGNQPDIYCLSNVIFKSVKSQHDGFEEFAIETQDGLFHYELFFPGPNHSNALVIKSDWIKERFNVENMGPMLIGRDPMRCIYYGKKDILLQSLLKNPIPDSLVRFHPLGTP